MEGAALCDKLSRGSTSFAKECTDAAVYETDPRRKIQLLLNAAWLNERLGRKRAALDLCEEALQIDSKCILALIRKGKLSVSMGKSGVAQAAWKSATQCAKLHDDFVLIAELQDLLQGQPRGVQGQPPARNGTVQNGNIQNGNGNVLPPSLRKYPFLEPGLSNSQRKSLLAKYLKMEEILLHDLLGVADLAIKEVNSGNLDRAVGICSYVLIMAESAEGGLKSTARLHALLTRGSARALLSNLPSEDQLLRLEEAIDDFTQGIEHPPGMHLAEFYKRRGQSLMAAAQLEGALKDFETAFQLSGTADEKADALREQGLAHQKMRQFRQAKEKLEQAVRLNARSAQIWNQLGLCRTTVGNLGDAVMAFQQAVRLEPAFYEAWLNMGQASKEKADPGPAKKALEMVMRGPDKKMKISAMKMLAQMTHGCGDHLEAARILNAALEVEDGTPTQRIECSYLLGVCYHGLGYHEKAGKAYYQTISVAGSQSLADQEVIVFQYLAVYQDLMAQYMRLMIDVPMRDFCFDRDFSAELKEAWCKKAPPNAALVGESSWRAKAHEQSSKSVPPPAPPADAVRALRDKAAEIGPLVQYRHQGFLPNKRQQMMSGLAVIEAAQFVAHLVRERSAGREVYADPGASLGRTRHPVGWRDYADIPVKWRQLSEPNDQVVWVDLLTEREFSNGFGSHTPIFSGQTQCVRYYMNFERALRLFKEQVQTDGYTFNAQGNKVGVSGKKDEIARAPHAWEVYSEINEDSWVVLQIKSAARPEHKMEGTRLTLVKVPSQPEGVEFSIRTPVTPQRWNDFDEELTILWNEIISAMCESNKLRTAEAILKYAYFWYNFMPLARGTAVVGYISILSLFMAAGMPVEASIPPGVQVDWEAILAKSADDFIASVSPWLYPPAVRGVPASEVPDQLAGLPRLDDVLITPRHRLEALNRPGMDPV